MPSCRVPRTPFNLSPKTQPHKVQTGRDEIHIQTTINRYYQRGTSSNAQKNSAYAHNSFGVSCSRLLASLQASIHVDGTPECPAVGAGQLRCCWPLWHRPTSMLPGRYCRAMGEHTGTLTCLAICLFVASKSSRFKALQHSGPIMVIFRDP